MTFYVIRMLECWNIMNGRELMIDDILCYQNIRKDWNNMDGRALVRDGRKLIIYIILCYQNIRNAGITRMTESQ